MSKKNMGLYLQAAAEEPTMRQNLMDATERLEGAALSAALAEQATAAGYEVSPQEAEALREELSEALAAGDQGDELGEEDLEAVAGGGIPVKDAGAAAALTLSYPGGPAAWYLADQMSNGGRGTKAVKDFFSKW